MLNEPQVGDPVRVDDDPQPWRVIDKNHKTGVLTLEALRRLNRVQQEVHEFRCTVAGQFV